MGFTQAAVGITHNNASLAGSDWRADAGRRADASDGETGRPGCSRPSHRCVSAAEGLTGRPDHIPRDRRAAGMNYRNKQFVYGSMATNNTFKGNSSCRPVSDYRAVNATTRTNRRTGAKTRKSWLWSLLADACASRTLKKLKGY